nr:phosphoribosyltransferase family protein [uncultured Sediminibacterium sp.]
MYELAIAPMERVWHLYYYFKKDSPDYLTHQLMDFKGDKASQIAAFPEAAAEAFSEMNIQFDYVLRVLGSDEVSATKGNRVRNIAIAIKNAVGAEYQPTLLTKKRKTRSLKTLNLAQRQAELEDVYVLSTAIDLNGKSVLLVDDISTTGTSLEVISKLIKATFPECLVYGFMLAKTSNPDFGGPDRNDEESELHYREILEKHVTKAGK